MQARWILLSHPPEEVAVADMQVLTTSAEFETA
jgi:hypothetical protein